MNKEFQNRITQVENLIQGVKADLKSWASQIGQYHKQLKELSHQVEAIKNRLNMKPNLNQPKTNK